MGRKKVVFQPAKYLNDAEMEKLHELSRRFKLVRTDKEVYDLQDKFDLLMQIAYERRKYEQLKKDYEK